MDTGSQSKPFLIILLLYPIFHYIYLAIRCLLPKKEIFTFSKNSSICIHFWKHYTERHIFFKNIVVPNKIFKTFFTKSNLVRSYYSINVYIIYWNRTFVLVKFVFNIAKRYYSLPILHMTINFLHFFIFIIFLSLSIYSTFFSQVSILQFIYDFTFANFVNNAAIINTVYT